VSEPARIRAAEDKALQLHRAHELGLSVPDSIWTNDVEAAKASLQRWGDAAVVKSLATAWWEDCGGGRFVFASLIGSEGLPASARLATAPVCFQQPIWPKRDIRATVVEGVVLGAIRGKAQEGADGLLDWRRAPQEPWSRYELPVLVASACRDLVRQFGLRFSGIDLALDEAGRHWFLELNPNGEWGWLQRSGLPIAEALADTLAAPERT
jgi:glutathione synthase/RimK-type ligase-like ATP-grasp enzyme